MSGIVDRLRGTADICPEQRFTRLNDAARAMLREAADEIERMQRELSDAEDALTVAYMTGFAKGKDEARSKAFIEAAEIAEGYDETETLTAPKYIAAAIRAKAESDQC